MNTRSDARSVDRLPAAIVLLGLGLACAVALAGVAIAADMPAAVSSIQQRTFKTPEAAAEALIVAAENFDVPALTQIFGPDGVDLVVSEDQVSDRNTAAGFAAQARTKTLVTRDPDNK